MLPDPTVQPFLTVDEWVEATGGRVKRTAAYAAVRRGEITSVRFGRKLFVLTAAAWRLCGLDPPGNVGPPLTNGGPTSGSSSPSPSPGDHPDDPRGEDRDPQAY